MLLRWLKAEKTKKMDAPERKIEMATMMITGLYISKRFIKCNKNRWRTNRLVKCAQDWLTSESAVPWHATWNTGFLTYSWGIWVILF